MSAQPFDIARLTADPNAVLHDRPGLHAVNDVGEPDLFEGVDETVPDELAPGDVESEEGLASLAFAQQVHDQVNAAKAAVFGFDPAPPVTRAQRQAFASRDRAMAEPEPVREDLERIPDPRQDPAWEPGELTAADIHPQWNGPELAYVPTSEPVWRDETDGAPVIGARVTDLPAPALRCAAAIAPPADLHDFLVLDIARRRQIIVLASTEGLGKSAVRRELAVRLATGSGALFGHYAIPAAARVALFDEDNGEPEEFRGEEALLATLGVDRSALGNYFRASYLGVNLNTPTGQRRLEDAIAAVHPALVILDTAGSMVGDEWGREMKAAMRFLRALTVRQDCAVLLVVHLTKPPREGNAGEPGRRVLTDVMGQWTRAADVVAVMTDLGEGRARWETYKRVPKSVLILAQRSGLWDVVGVGETAQRVRTDDRVLACVDAGATTVGDVQTATGLPERTVWDAVKRLRRAGILTARGALRRDDDERGPSAGGSAE